MTQWESPNEGWEHGSLAQHVGGLEFYPLECKNKQEIVNSTLQFLHVPSFFCFTTLCTLSHYITQFPMW